MASTRERVLPVLKILLAVTLTVVLLVNVSFEKIVVVIRSVLVGWLIITGGLFILVNWAKAYQYHLLLSGELPFKNVLNVVFVQNVVSNLLATGAGIASLFVLFNTEHRLKVNRTLGIFLLAKLGDLTQILFFLSIATWVVWDAVGPLHLFLIVLLLGIVTGLSLFFLAFFLRERLLVWLRGIITPSFLKIFPPIVRLLDMLEAIVGFDNKFVLGILGRVFFGAFVYMIVTLGWIYATLRTFQFSTGMMPLIFVSELQQLISYLPIQVLGGLGVNELSTVYLFSLFGYETELLIAIAVGARVLSYLMNGALFLYLLATGVWERSRVGNKLRG